MAKSINTKRQNELLNEFTQEVIDCTNKRDIWYWLRQTFNGNDSISLLICGLSIKRFLDKKKLLNAHVDNAYATTLRNKVYDSISNIEFAYNSLLCDLRPIENNVNEFRKIHDIFVNLSISGHDDIRFVNDEIKRYLQKLNELKQSLTEQQLKIANTLATIYSICKNNFRNEKYLSTTSYEIDYLTAVEKLEKYLLNPIEHDIFTPYYIHKQCGDIYILLESYLSAARHYENYRILLSDGYIADKDRNADIVAGDLYLKAGMQYAREYWLRQQQSKFYTISTTFKNTVDNALAKLPDAPSVR